MAVDWLFELLGTPVLPELLESFGPLSFLIMPPLLLKDESELEFELELDEELELELVELWVELVVEKKDGLLILDVLPPLPELKDLLELLVVRMSD